MLLRTGDPKFYGPVHLPVARVVPTRVTSEGVPIMYKKTTTNNEKERETAKQRMEEKRRKISSFPTLRY